MFHDAPVEKNGTVTPAPSSEPAAVVSPASQETVQFPPVASAPADPAHKPALAPSKPKTVLPQEDTVLENGSVPSKPPQLPSRDNTLQAPTLPPRKRKPFFWKRDRSGTTNSTMSIASRSNGSSTANFDLLLSRMTANQESLTKIKEISNGDGLKELSARFEAIRAELEPQIKERQSEESSTGEPVEEGIDWDLWEQVVNDYITLAKNSPVELSLAIAQGIPAEFRGIIWQVITGSKSNSLEELYVSIVLEDSPHEKAIRRDLSRTSFIKSADPESLYKVIKAYSLFDPEVGYTQGMAFVTVPLLISLHEAEAFGMLVKLMKDYGLREFFLPEMPGLHLRLYQFDRILEDTLPDVHIHLARQGVRSNMYTSQWFLTLFAYKFPLQIVQRIFDVVIAEGIEALLRFAVGLMKRNAATILSLEFDHVLTFLKDHIFDYYVEEGATAADGGPEYRVNDLVADAYDVKILPVQLKKYENEYIELHCLEQERIKEVEDLRNMNGQLTQRIKRLETTVADLTNEHLTVTNELAHERTKTAKLDDENEELRAAKASLEASLEGIGENGAVEFAKMKIENQQLHETKIRLENQLTNLERELAETREKFEGLDDEHSKLKVRWEDLKKALQD